MVQCLCLFSLALNVNLSWKSLPEDLRRAENILKVHQYLLCWCLAVTPCHLSYFIYVFHVACGVAKVS